MVYSSSSARAEKQRGGKTDHLPAATEASQKELTADPPVYTSRDIHLGEKGLNQRPLLTTATSSPPVYSSDNPGEKGLDGQPLFTIQASNPPVHSTESPGEKGLDKQPLLTTAIPSAPIYGLDEQSSLTTQTPTSQPTAATPTTSGIDDTA